MDDFSITYNLKFDSYTRVCDDVTGEALRIYGVRGINSCCRTLDNAAHSRRCVVMLPSVNKTSSLSSVGDVPWSINRDCCGW
jgi:hypothetical protein